MFSKDTSWDSVKFIYIVYSLPKPIPLHLDNSLDKTAKQFIIIFLRALDFKYLKLNKKFLIVLRRLK